MFNFSKRDIFIFAAGVAFSIISIGILSLVR